jgi:hypothetical protein
MVREWIRTFAEFPVASFLFAIFIFLMTMMTFLWTESVLGGITTLISTIKAVHVEREQDAGEVHRCPTPTPPASSTVTLQRWSFVTDDRTGSPVAFPNPNGQWVKYEDALVLLRAAERQK